MSRTSKVDLGIFLAGSVAAFFALFVSGRLALCIDVAVNLFAVVMVTGSIMRKVEATKQAGGNPKEGNPPAGCLVLFVLCYVTFLVEIPRMGALVVVISLLVVVAALAFGRLSIRHVPIGHVGIIRRRYGPSDPEFPYITPRAAQGVLARILLPGRHWMTPFLYEVRFVPRTHVAEGRIGLVTAKEGRTRPTSRPLARPVACGNFRNGQDFLLNGGEQGTQVEVLAGGQSYYINTALFDVEEVDRVHVPRGTIGLVDAKAGGARPPGLLFGPYVECDDFQDGGRFLDGGGQQGSQLAILQGGTYYDINPALFDVITVNNVEGKGELTAAHLQQVSVPIGCVGVVITLDGREPEESGRLGPRIPGHQGFRLPWVFLQNGGYRGVQEETLREGTICALNPYFVRVVLVPTRVLFLEWKYKTRAEEVSNYDAHLGQIVATVEGYRLLVDMSQTLQIPATAAPSLVSKFGDSQTTGLGGLDQNRLPVQRFVERVLGAAVETYFSQSAAEETIAEFLEGYAQFRVNLAARVSQELDKWGVKALDTTLAEFRSEDPALNEVLKRAANERVRSTELALMRDNAEHEDAIDAVRVRAENRRMAQELKARIDLLGLDNVMVLEMLQEITKAPVPQFIGGGDLSSFLETQPVARLEGLLDRMRNLNAGAVTEAPGNAAPGNAAPGIQDKQQPSLPEAGAPPAAGVGGEPQGSGT